ncbi:(Fe-S)-binding protein [Pararhodospirillum oryzae]|uniref:Fe-S cluster protein n=1 Tax=Pararhodospirillum oryzae TaxID=478448 RepID=A0A512HB70_9PROT|nr:(Fe-S)-binding protein [Pararhodospirillum oryzae]GEO82630.1 Fe-S cluster protein [Pararhodospirillum oryzae]
MTKTLEAPALPGLDCGVCGYRTCSDLSARLDERPDLLRRCIHLSPERARPTTEAPACAGCGPEGAARVAASLGSEEATANDKDIDERWRDSLGRPFDFFLEHFPEDPGPREIILPHNPLLTRELDVQVGDILIGRPLGMSCGCPITHCGVAVEVDARTGVIVWCVTGPLGPRAKGFKDLGYYIAEGYEGLITESRLSLHIGMRYYFQPRLCMLQWRHSGLINFINNTPEGARVRLEGLWIG